MSAVHDALLVDDPVPGVRRLTFNRPEAHNAFDMATFATFEMELQRASDDVAVRVIVLGARGGKAFSAGFDIREMAGFDTGQLRQAFELRDPVFLRVARHRCPVIAAIDGIAYGAGALLALAADLRLATPGFRFKVTAVGYGGANATWSLPRAVGPSRAKDILMTGRAVAADEALAIGLVNRVVPPGELDEAALALASAIAAHPPEGVTGVKQLVDAAAGLSLADGWRAEFDWMRASLSDAPAGGDMFGGFLSRRK